MSSSQKPSTRRVQRDLQSATAPNARRRRSAAPAAPLADADDEAFKAEGEAEEATVGFDVDAEVEPKYCVRCGSKKTRKVKGQLLCASHYYTQLSHTRQCTHGSGTVDACIFEAAKTYALCPRHLGKLDNPPEPLAGDIASDEDASGFVVAAAASSSPQTDGGVEVVPRRRIKREPHQDGDASAPQRKHHRKERRPQRDTTPTTSYDSAESSSSGDEAPPRREPIPPTVIEYLNTIPDFVRCEIEAEFSVGPPEPVPVEESLALKFAERLADSVEGAAFARPVVDPARPPPHQRIFLARDAPISDVYVDPLDGHIYVRFSTGGCNSRVADSHAVLTLEEVSAYYPQVLIDFLLSSVIFHD